jgi:hypothetical protein
MRAIRVTFRAVFANPLPPINPSGWPMRGQFPVEIFGDGQHWKAREIATPRREVYKKLMDFGNVESGMRVVEAAFGEKVQDWQLWGMPPDPEVAEERILLPHEVCDLGNGKWGWYTAEDRTHISTGGGIHHGKATVACGAQVPPKIVISTKANIEPTCPKCAEVYQKEFANR